MPVEQFDTIEYLASGTLRQVQAYRLLNKYRVIDVLLPFSPILTGTIPINIDIESSDLDIICQYTTTDGFSQHLEAKFSVFEDFSIKTLDLAGSTAVLANFCLDGFPVEVFGQQIPVKQQMAYRHLLIEHQLLLQKAETFRQQIIDLKKQGMKTEPAFAVTLGLEGDPYTALLNFEV
ncbi:DUF4269 domain-containing protein [Mucilaginibacter celer]|uniref:DUF4269 domain-containing protein n=1 Tax=Mucilaginibacter celer TaxID=2305508 RepID=A0A494VQ01_9SPHI|nr:DUF4269 domain-containing protein [Mucilaginibacter celer]AYL96379.1 DUF4269 domain-containing protein [Mucilaginibacter celer]